MSFSEQEIKEYLSDIEYSIEKMCEYVQAVCINEVARKGLKAMQSAGLIDPAEYRDKVEDYDRKRKMAHDAAMAEMGVLNAICRQTERDPVCPDTENTLRSDCGKYMAAVVGEFFLKGTGRDEDALKQMGAIFGTSSAAAGDIVDLIEKGILG